MDADRIEQALKRIETALARAEAARDARAAADTRGQAGTARVVELVNSHEKMRERVTESLRELDDLIARMEG